MKNKKTLYIFLSIVILCLCFTYFKKDQVSVHEMGSKIKKKVVNQPQELPVLKVKDLKTSESKETNEVTTVLSSEEDITESKCWENIFQKYKENTKYYSQNKTHLLKYIGPWFYGKESLNVHTHETELPGLFMLAMAKSGLLLGVEDQLNGESNIPESLDLLNAVMLEDPSNSAPILMAAYLNKKINNLNKYKELIEKVKHTKRFDTYESIIIQSFYKGVETPEDLVAAINIRSKHPVIAISGVKNLLIEEKQINVAYQMLDSATDPIHRVTDQDWSESMTYAVADIVLKELGDKTVRKPSGAILAEKMKPCHENVMEDYLSEIKEWQAK